MTYAAAAHTAFDQNLAMLDGLLAKAARHEAGDDLLAVRLAEDMLPLATQIRFVGHQVVNTLNLLAGGDYTLSETDPATLAQARAHITDLRAMMADHPAQDWAGSGEQVEFGPGQGYTFAAQAHEYTRDWALPNFYFHAVTAYAILRHQGLAIGKADFLPYMMRYLVQPSG